MNESEDRILTAAELAVAQKVSAVLPADLHTRLVERAREEDRSVSAQLRVAVREHVEPQLANGTEREPVSKR